ncbi:SDR family oxidoreductase [Solimonas marina]|uniref:Aldehyde reductase n=1 Tax=Solimonas marina TaxID=2714601 RepID=A0A969WB95_9GAMM|nr:aldehyde reductase [Solimonas marina]NKF23802.1 aldehyde reductase [Solimonas marina]
MSQPRVVVTGGSGFIAGHCILKLLAQGHLVHATVRSLDKATMARRALEAAGMAYGERLSFATADLMRDDGWAEVVAGADYVLHVASPVLPGHVPDESAVIGPAVEGSLRVLRAARDAGVKRVVLTSAFHAVSWGYPHSTHVFTDDDWTRLDGPGVDAYGKSKTLAERAAWDFVAREGGAMELTTMLPVAVMGPVMGQDISGANHIVQRMLKGAMPGLPNLYIPIVDVRDVAHAHVAALRHPQAAGQRFLLSNGAALSMREIGAVLRAELGNAARAVPTRAIPDLVMRAMGLFRPEIRAFVPDLGYAKNSSNEKARRVLEWLPRDSREAIVSAGRSMIDRGLIEV